MPWSCIACLSLIVCLGGPGLLAEDDAAWRAGAVVLTERIEKLAAAGEVQAAETVLTELLGRPRIGETGLDDRARMALAKGLQQAGRIDDALTQVDRISWADKSPEVASRIIALQLDILWGGLFDHRGRLVSGAIPPLASPESDSGSPGGVWLDRRERFTAFKDLYQRGVAMVRAEGGSVPMPGAAGLRSLARYAYGLHDHKELGEALGASATWTPELTGQVARLHLDEHLIERSFALAQGLWQRQPESAAARMLAERLLLWQGRRQALADQVHLYPFPAIDEALATIRKQYPEVAVRVADLIASDAGLQRVSMGAEPVEVEVDIVSDPVIEGAAVELEGQMVFAYVTSYDDLAVRALVPVQSAGQPVVLRTSSAHVGEHTLGIYRLPDAATAAALRSKPEQVLTAPRQLSRSFTVADWDQLGRRQQHDTDIGPQDVGFYAVTVSARGAPIVAVATFCVVDVDLHLQAGEASILAWAVQRADGTAAADQPVVITADLIRDVERLVVDWDERDPAWKAGFRQAFFAADQSVFVQNHQRAQHVAGQAAGREAALKDPPRQVRQALRTAADGLARMAIPADLQGRPLKIRAHIDRPDIAVASKLRHGTSRPWRRKAVAWADRPLVRPGETLHWKVLLRDFDGEQHRLPTGAVAITLKLDARTIQRLDAPINDLGTIAGTTTIPPGAEPGRLTLVIDDDKPRHLAKVERVQLPDLRWRISGLADGEQVRCGETAAVDLVLADRRGSALAGHQVQARLRTWVEGTEQPAKKLPPQQTDAGGRVSYRLPTLADQRAMYRLEWTVAWQGRPYQLRHSWQTRLFPFACELAIADDQLQVGRRLVVQARCPAGARLHLQLERDGVAIGPRAELAGVGTSWASWVRELGNEDRGATHVRVMPVVLDGEAPSRLLPITVSGRPDQTDDSGDFVFDPGLGRVDPGDVLPCRIRSVRRGRDSLIVVGTSRLLTFGVHRLAQSLTAIDLAVETQWAPGCHVQAVAYDPAKGFITSKRHAVQVRPINRLLQVHVATDRQAYDPNDEVRTTVLVQDWQGKPVAGASLAIGVVDERLYQLAADETPDLWKYFHHYQRPWAIGVGRSVPLDLPQSLMWKSVIKRWQQLGGAFGYRNGGGRRRAVGRYGGSKASSSALLVDLEQEAAVHWVADLRTDASGQAVVQFAMPAVPGRFRLTARANDGSKEVLVGMVRHQLVSRPGLVAAVAIEPAVEAGEVLPVRVRLANEGREAASYTVSVDGAEPQRVSVPAAGQRELLVPKTIAPCEPTRLAHVLPVIGEKREVVVTIRRQGGGGAVTEIRRPYLVRYPGLTRQWHGTVLADEDGRIALPEVRPGAAVHLEIASWPDAASRCRDDLSRARRHGPWGERAWAWLHAEDSRERDEALQELWQQAVSDPEAAYVRQEAWRQGLISSGGATGDAGPLGYWLLARARYLGQPVVEPGCRGRVGGSTLETVCFAATARLAGWGEGEQVWRQAMQQLEEELADGSFDPGRDLGIAAAVAADTANLLRAADASAHRDRLGRLHWGAALTRVIAWRLLAGTEARADAKLTLVGAGAPQAITTEWLGVVDQTFALRAAPGTIAAIHLHWHDQAPLVDQAETVATWRWYRELGDRFEPLAADAPLPPGSRVLAEWSGRGMPYPDEVTVRLPAGLILDQGDEQVTITAERYRTWHLDEDVDVDDDPVVDIRQRWDAWLATHQGEEHSRVDQVRTADVDFDPETGQVLIAPTAKRWGFVCRVRHAGMAPALPTETVNYKGRWRVPTRPHRFDVAADTEPAVDAFTVRQAVRTAIASMGRHDLAQLEQIAAGGRLRAWREALAVLDREGDQSLGTLLEYAPQGRVALRDPDHWMLQRLRSWAPPTTPAQVQEEIEAWDYADDAVAELGLRYGLIEEDRDLVVNALDSLPVSEDPDDWEGQLLAGCARIDRVLQTMRQTAWLRGGGVGPVPVQERRPIRTILTWLQADKRLPADLRPWLLMQELDASTLRLCGYGTDLAGYAKFLQHELAITLAFGDGIAADIGATLASVHQREVTLHLRATPGGQALIAGAGLGAEGLAAAGFTLVRNGERWRLLRLGAPLTTGLAVDVWSVCGDADILTRVMNEALVQAGRSPVRLLPKSRAKSYSVHDGMPFDQVGEALGVRWQVEP